MVLSDDSQWVLFSSLDPLVENDVNARSDIYLRNLGSGELTKITPSTAADPRKVVLGNSVLGPRYSLSRDAGLVAFTSDLPNLTPGDDNDGVDVFTWRRSDGHIQRETVSESGENACSPGSSLLAATNADGSKVAYSTTSTKMTSVSTRTLQQRGTDLFEYSEAFIVRWLAPGQTQPVHRDSSGQPTGTFASRQYDLPMPQMDGTGDKVIYSQPLLTPGVNTIPGSPTDIFLRDFALATSVLLGRAIEDGTSQDLVDPARNPSISLDGHFAAFLLNTIVGQMGSVVRLDLVSQAQQLISQGSSDSFPFGSTLALNAAGDLAAFDTDLRLTSDDQNNQRDVYLWNASDQSYRRLSPSAPNLPLVNRGSFSSAISADGNWIAFRSSEQTLVPGKPGKYGDVYLYDRTAGTLDNLTYNSTTPPVPNRYLDATPFHDQNDFLPPRNLSFSADGRYLCFISYYDDLSSDDQNNLPDVYVFDRVRCAFCLLTRGTNLKSTEGFSLSCSISADGNWIVFDSDSAELVSGDDNLVSDVFKIRNPLAP